MQFFVRRQTLIDKISFLGFVVFGTRGMLLPTTTSAVSQNDPTNKEKLLYSLLYHTKTLFFVTSLLKLLNVIILITLFSKTAPPILMKLYMYIGHVQGKVLVPLAPLVIAPFKRKAAGGRLHLASC